MERIRSNRPEAAAEPIGGDEAGAGADTEAACVGGGAGERGGALVGADPLRTRQLGQQGDEDAAGAGAEIEQPERLIAPALPLDDGERGLDQGLGVGARVEHLRIDAEAPAVELAVPVMRATGSCLRRRAMAASSRARAAG